MHSVRSRGGKLSFICCGWWGSKARVPPPPPQTPPALIKLMQPVDAGEAWGHRQKALQMEAFSPWAFSWARRLKPRPSEVGGQPWLWDSGPQDMWAPLKQPVTHTDRMLLPCVSLRFLLSSLAVSLTPPPSISPPALSFCLLSSEVHIRHL